MSKVLRKMGGQANKIQAHDARDTPAGYKVSVCGSESQDAQVYAICSLMGNKLKEKNVFLAES